MLGIKITTDCEVKKIDVSEPLHISIREELGGHLEIVRPRRLKQPLCMIVDEEGLLKKLPVNLMGSYLYETDKHGHPVVGDIIIMKEQMTIDGIELIGLSAQDISDFMQEHKDALYHFERCVKDGVVQV